MVSTTFISYGNRPYRQSLSRIGEEAKKLQLFTHVKLYTDDDLPSPFSEYAKTYGRGGGYWLWKPYIVHETLKQMDEGDILVYADAGCTLQASHDWQTYLDILQRGDTYALFFLAEGKNRKWCKREVFDFFTPSCQLWKRAHQIQATAFMVRKRGRGMGVFDRWYDLALCHPSLFTDVASPEDSAEDKRFREHRHDQSVLSALVCMERDWRAIAILPEKMEKHYPDGQAILASRISSTDVRGVTSTSKMQNRAVAFFNLHIVKPLQIITTRLLFWMTRLRNEAKNG